MKRGLFSLMVLLTTISIFAQSSKGIWDAKTATYTNSAHQITWKLFDEWDWESRPNLSDDTILNKVRNYDTNILVKIGVVKGVKDAPNDTWDSISQIESPQYQDMYKTEAKKLGMEFLGSKASRSQLSGVHAIKQRVDMGKYYPEYKQTSHLLEISYFIFKRNNLYTITVSGLSVSEDEIELFDRIANLLFNGFKMN